MVGSTVHVLIEKQDHTTGEGFSENYERVSVSGLAPDQEGAIVTVAVTGTDGNTLLGTIKEEI